VATVALEAGSQGNSSAWRLGDVGFGDAVCHLTHAGKQRLALRHTHSAARIKDVEGVRALEQVIVSG